MEKNTYHITVKQISEIEISVEAETVEMAKDIAQYHPNHASIINNKFGNILSREITKVVQKDSITLE